MKLTPEKSCNSSSVQKAARNPKLDKICEAVKKNSLRRIFDVSISRLHIVAKCVILVSDKFRASGAEAVIS